jgi:hypothetical protein
MNKKEFQKELLLYTAKRLNETDFKDQERTVQLAYQLGIAIGLLYDLTDADSYNYKRILYTLHPELKNKK